MMMSESTNPGLQKPGLRSRDGQDHEGPVFLESLQQPQ